MSEEIEPMTELPGGERPKTTTDWLYKAAVLLCFVLIYCGKLYVDNGYVSKTDHAVERAADKIEYEADKKATQERQNTIIAQNQELLLGINEIKVRMEGNIVRDHNYDDLKKKVEDLQTYVYTHH